MSETAKVAEAATAPANLARTPTEWKKHWRTGVVVIAIALAFAFLKPLGNDARTRALATMKESHVSLSLNADGTLDSAEFRLKPSLESERGNLSWVFDQLRRFPEVKAVSTEYLMQVNVPTLWDLPNLESFTVTQRAEIDEEDFAAFAKMAKLESLELRADKIGPAALAHLTNLSKLKSLKLVGGNWSGDGLRSLARMPSLERLSIEGTVRTEQALQLGVAPRLKVLRLAHLSTTPQDLQGLEELQSVEEIYLMNARLHPNHFAQLKNLPKLKTLKINGGVETLDEVATSIAAMPALETLAISSYSGAGWRIWLTTEGLARIAESKSIREIEVTGTPVGDLGIKAIAGMPNLRALSLSQTGATEASLSTLLDMPSLERLAFYEPFWEGKGISPDRMVRFRDEFAIKWPKTAVTLRWTGGYW